MSLVARELGLMPYRSTLEAMQQFTRSRQADTPDELWLLQHPAVYTVGQAGRAEHLPRNDQTGVRHIPIEQIDRGGQITYHGPGQLVVYTLLDLRRLGMGIREVVSQLEQAVINLLTSYALQAERKSGAPGVYVDGAKIAALGLRVRNGCCYHGLSLNIDMDLSPYLAIDPCGYRDLPVTQLRSLGVVRSVAEAGSALLPHLQECLGLRDAPTAHSDHLDSTHPQEITA
jgi:lipoyl(octanoyl) transferase